jgi:hypothetical protein
MGADKILLKELGLCPKIKPTEPTVAQLNRQDYVVIEELLTLGRSLVHLAEAQNKEPKRSRQHQHKPGHPDIEGRSPDSHQNQNGSPGIRGRVTRQPTEPKRITLTKGVGHPERREFQQADDRIKNKTQTNDLLKSRDFRKGFATH